jgi:soluble lytic murein transglycosylase-like protein
LPERGSSFPRIELLLLLLAFPLFTAGCGPRLVWGIPGDELKRDLAGARYARLSSIDFASQDPGECLALSPEAPYYLSIIFDSLEKPAQALVMLELARSRSPSPWKEEAGLLLLRRYVAEKSWDKALDAARELAASPRTPDVEQRGRRLLVEALYWSRDDAAVLREAEKLTAPDDEVLLIRAVSSLRLGLAPAHDLVMQLFLRVKVSALHGRAFSFISADPSFLQLFSARDQALLAGKNALVSGAWAMAIPALEGVLESIDPQAVADGSLVIDLGNAYQYSSRFLPGAHFMEKLAPRLAEQAQADAREQAGRLYRRARDFPRALAQFRIVAVTAPAAAQRDRARWFIADILFETSPNDLAAQVAAESALWSDRSYFIDLLQERIADLVAARAWKTLAGLWRALRSTGPDVVCAQLSYLLAREWQEGVILRLPGSPPLTARELFMEAENRDPSGYYGILAASILGDMPDRMIASDAKAEPAADLDPLSIGFITFGLTGQAYGKLWPTRDSLSNAELMSAARAFAAAGDYRSSLYFVGALGRKRRLSAAELQMYYPRAFSALIEPLAQGAGFPDHLLYGLIREESYFDPRVVSSAGAVGLSQLMPATAADIARSLKIIDPDLRDPTTNLTIGVHHFRDMLASAKTPTKAMLAYNAGLTRVRQWERAAPGIPADLFVETVPLAEPRDYVRKILVSAVMYAFLYHGADPREAALSFFSLERGPLEPERTTGPSRGAQPR